jgi:hypothetical protein
MRLLVLTSACSLLLSGQVLAATYYVSADSGDDDNNGQSSGAPFETLGRVNDLDLQPGDEVRLFCGETWRADPLEITDSGTASQPIVFTTHPVGCADRPLLSGAHGIAGWSLHAADVWVTDLDLGANAGKFPHGVNQLFRGADRLPFGRWPDIEGHADGGWASIDAQPAANRIRDAELPTGVWTGAVAHIRGMTWYILNRSVLADSGSTLTLSENADCFNGSCAGWGYFLSHHLMTLSREGEWYWDPSSNRVYLYTTGGAPGAGEVEGSAVLVDDDRYHGGVVLGRDLQEHVAHVVVENLRIERWYGSGVATPTNLELAENHHVTLRDLAIRDVDDAGLRLTTWVWNAGSQSGWRGGRDMVVERLLIERANHYGIDSFAHSTTFRDIQITDVGRIPFAGRSGIGCGLDTSGGFCTEAGAGVRLKRHLDAHSSHSLTLERLRLERIGMNGIDAFGDTITITDTVIREACVSKSDCGGIRTFGQGDLGSTPVHDILIQSTIVRDVLATNAGCHADYRFPLGMGLYIDHWSRNVDVEGVTVTGCRPTGVLYQNSTGDVSDTVVYDIVPGTWGGTGVVVVGGGHATVHDSVLFSLDPTVNLVSINNTGQLPAANRNALFSPWDLSSLCVGGTCHDLAGWQSATGLDGSSGASWYTRDVGDPPLSAVFVNETATDAWADLGGAAWTDLEQNPVGSLLLPPFSSAVLVRRADVIFIDGFESGDTTVWSHTQP